MEREVSATSIIAKFLAASRALCTWLVGPKMFSTSVCGGSYASVTSYTLLLCDFIAVDFGQLLWVLVAVVDLEEVSKFSWNPLSRIGLFWKNLYLIWHSQSLHTRQESKCLKSICLKLYSALEQGSQLPGFDIFCYIPEGIQRESIHGL